MTTNVPEPTFGPLGFLPPDESAILAGVQADMQAAFKGNLNFATPSTPQSQWAVSLTAIIGDKNDQFLSYVNGVDPAYNDGRMQDAIGRIYFLTRNPAEPTSVQCVCIGAVGTVIPELALVQDGAGNQYYAVSGGTIPGGGSITLEFANVNPGPTPCVANTVTTIVKAIPGWDSVNNPADGILGQATESRADFEFRREQTVAANAVGTIGAVVGAVFKVSGVLDVYGYSNNTSGSVTVNGVTITANAIYVCVAGGADADIGQAILSKKGPGAPMVGSTSLTVYDNNPLYAAPIPYTVNFQRPTPQNLLVFVNIANSNTVPADVLAKVQAAVLATFSGADGGQRARIGQTNYASRYYAGIASLGIWAQIISITVGSASGSTAATGTAASIAGTTLTVGGTITGAFAVGQAVNGANVQPGTYITALGSGTGGAGTYVVNQSQTAASAAISAYAMNAASVATAANQIPTLAPSNVFLKLT